MTVVHISTSPNICLTGYFHYHQLMASTMKTTYVWYSLGLSNTQLPKQLIFSQLTSSQTHNSSEINLHHEYPSCPRITCRAGSPATNSGTAVDEHIGPRKVTRLSLHLKDTVSGCIFLHDQIKSSIWRQLSELCF